MEEESTVMGESVPLTKQVKGDEHMVRVCPAAAAAADGGYFPIPLNKEREAARLISSHVRIGLARSLGRRALHVNCGCLSVCLSTGLSVLPLVRRPTPPFLNDLLPTVKNERNDADPAARRTKLSLD